ncbi:MAG TPA: diphthine synthase [Candidatus Thermoplasmatota archaeon]|nr:diphthine synthase [Candidatus Thermoplasmatota archaeon]
MGLHLVGLGLHDPRSITVRGLEVVRAADVVYAEFYTAIMSGTPAELEAFLGRPVTVLDRLGVEKGGPKLLEESRSKGVALLVAGDPMAATTHADLLVRFRQAGVPLHVVHAPSIFSAAPGLLGLQHYKFGRATTLVKPEKGWSPTSPFDAIAENHQRGLHTLVLLDIKSDLGYFMTANEAFAILLDLAQRTGNAWFGPETQVGVVARAGSDPPGVTTGSLAELQRLDFGPPLHCLVVAGALQVVEQEAWDSFAVSGASRSP